jgi:hypothetical protein
MAKPPKPLVLSVDALGGDAPEWAAQMFAQLNQWAAQVDECLSGGISRADNLAATEKLALVFTTKATAADTFPIKISHGLPTGKANHVVCTKLEFEDDPDGAISNAYSMSWSNASDGQLLVRFQGLANSTRYRANFTFE